MDDAHTSYRPEPHTISRPEQLLAELPALLHFVPAAPALVVFGQSVEHGPGATPIVRIDLPLPVVMFEYLTAVLGPVDGDLERYIEDTELAAVGDSARTQLWSLLLELSRLDTDFGRHITELCSTQRLSQAVVVAIVEGSCDAESPVWVSADILGAKLRQWMQRAGTELSATLVCERIAAGAPWRFADGEELLPQEDPQTSELAARSVVEGRQIHARREEIGALYAPEDGPQIVPEPLVPGDVADAGDGATYVATLVGLARPASPEASPLDDDRALQQAGDLICDATVFEQLLRHVTQAHSTAASPVIDRLHEDPAEAHADWFGADGRDLDLLAVLARRGDARCRGAALLLTAVIHYLAGNGVHTAECLEQARGCTFMSTFGTLLLGLVHRGESPRKVREMLQELLDPELPQTA